MGFLPTHYRCGVSIEVVAGEVFEGVVASLPWSPIVSLDWWGEECGEGGEECFSGDRGHPPVDPDHPIETPRRRYPPELLLFGFGSDGSRPVD